MIFDLFLLAHSDHHPCSAQVENNPTSSLQSVYGIFYVLATGLIVALLMAIGEYCIESRRGDSFRTQFTLFGQVRVVFLDLLL